MHTAAGTKWIIVHLRSFECRPTLKKKKNLKWLHDVDDCRG